MIAQRDKKSASRYSQNSNMAQIQLVDYLWEGSLPLSNYVTIPLFHYYLYCASIILRNFITVEWPMVYLRTSYAFIVTSIRPFSVNSSSVVQSEDWA